MTNQQVAPTIIQALGFDPGELQAVHKEQIHVLPFLSGGEVDNNVAPLQGITHQPRCPRHCDRHGIAS